MLYHANMTLIFIAREAENPNASPWEEQFKVGGGKALVYDSSLVCRVTRAAWVKEGTGDAAKVVGERHRVEIRKTKVAGKEGKTAEAFFHTSNGVITPTGFDRARDVFDMATDLGVIEKSGAWYSFNGERFQGESGTVRALNANPDMLASVEANCEPGEGEDAETG
jgi:recombination protein RecA